MIFKLIAPEKRSSLQGQSQFSKARSSKLSNINKTFCNFFSIANSYEISQIGRNLILTDDELLESFGHESLVKNGQFWPKFWFSPNFCRNWPKPDQILTKIQYFLFSFHQLL